MCALRAHIAAIAQVDQSELAFRMLCRKHGAELCYTPMFHSRLFAESASYREKMFEQHIHDRPLIVQVRLVHPTVHSLTARQRSDTHASLHDSLVLRQ